MNYSKVLNNFCMKQGRPVTSANTKKLLDYLKNKKYGYQEGNTVYYKDRWGKLRQFDNSPSKATPGTFRLIPLEGMYRWWRNKTPDVQNAIFPIFISMFTGFIIYNASNFVIEREESIMDHGRVPEYVNKEVFEKWKQSRQEKDK